MKTLSTKSLVTISVFASTFILANAFAKDDLFAKLDANTDGFIDSKEASEHKVVSENFLTIDKNADGMITREELEVFDLK